MLEKVCNFDHKHATEQQNDSRSTCRLKDYDQTGYVTTARRVLFKPVGFSTKISYCHSGIVLFRLSLNWLRNSFTDAIVLRDANDSALWNISNIQCKSDLITLDNTLDNEYASHLLSGKTLLISPHGVIPTNQQVLIKTPC